MRRSRSPSAARSSRPMRPWRPRAPRRSGSRANATRSSRRRRAGVVDEFAEDEVTGPYAHELAGDWAGAAAAWRELGCPYETALALASSGEEGAMREALDLLQQLGAAPAAAIVARRLRERGVRSLPRGPRPSTQSNPAGLTARELEVLVLLT